MFAKSLSGTLHIVVTRMPFLVDTAFRQYHDAIKLSRDHHLIANKRRDWLASRLGASMTLLDTKSIGSVPRYTALAGHADLDFLAVLHWGDHIKDRSPATVLNNVKTALGENAKSIRRNGQAVTVTFESWPSIDVVPASKNTNSDGTVNHYKIPDMNRGEWLISRPVKHGNAISDLAKGGSSVARPAIRMIKDWNRRQTPRMQSYHIEAIATQVSVDWSEYSWSLYRWFEAAAEATWFCWYEEENVSNYLSASQKSSVKSNLEAAKAIALQGWLADDRGDHEAAIGHWKRLFGHKFPAYG